MNARTDVEKASWPPYDAYKASELGLLGEIPVHWCTKQLRRSATIYLSNVDKKSAEGQAAVRLCNYTDVYYNDRIASTTAFMEATATPEQCRRFQVRVGDVLLTKDSETGDDIASPAVIAEDLPGVLCGYHLALLRPGPELFGGYLARAIACSPIRDHFFASATGVTRFGLSRNDIGTGVVPVPPVAEQKAIAAFLDRETARLDGLIEKRQRMIALLREKRAALITHAVTRGLDLDVPLKDSGVEWLGRIPAHWRAGQLRRFWRVTDCKHHTVPFFDEGRPVASIGELTAIRFSLSNAKLTTQEDFEFLRRGRTPKRGDLIYCRNASVGLVGYVDTDEPFALGQDVCMIRSSSGDSKYLYYALKSKLITDQLAAHMVGATFKRINVDAIKEFVVPCPSAAEQQLIAEHLDGVTRRIDRTLALTDQAVCFLTEYRASLITAAVTGQIDVRALAP